MNRGVGVVMASRRCLWGDVFRLGLMAGPRLRRTLHTGLHVAAGVCVATALPSGVAQAQDANAPARLRVLEAARAVQQGAASAPRGRWEQRLRQHPGDRLAMLGLATLARLSYRYDDADRLYSSMLRGATPASDAASRQAMLGLSASLMTRWRPSEAMPLLQQVAQAAEASGDWHAEGEALLMLSGAVARSAGGDSVARLVSRAARVISPTDTSLHARRLCLQGSLLRTRDLRQADSLVSEGLRLAERPGYGPELAYCLFVKGQVHEGKGEIARALDRLEDASKHAHAIRDEEALGAVRQWLAYVSVTYTGEFGRARSLAEMAIAHGKRVGSPLIVAWAELNLAQLSLRVGDASAAIRAAQASQRDFARLNDRFGQLAVLTILAHAHALSGRLDDAERAFLDVETFAAAQGVPNAIPLTMLRRALVLLERGDTAKASTLIEQGTADAVKYGIRGIVNSDQHYLRGLLQLRQGRYDAAVASFRAFQRGVGESAMHFQLDADLRIAEAFARAGRFVEAESVFVAGSASLDKMRRVVYGRDDLVRLLSGQRFEFDTDLGIATIVSLFAQSGRLDRAFGIAESERARWLWIRRTRRNALARDKGGAHVDALGDRILQVSDVQGMLGDDTAILEYVTGRGGEPTTVFAIWRGGARTYTLAAADSFAPAVARLAGALEAGLPSVALSRELGAALLDSALRVLPPSVRHLRIVPDGPVHHVPFDALITSNGDRLIERHVVSIAQSARLAVAPSSPASSGGRRGVLALGDAVFDSRFGLPRLRGSGDEAQRVVRAAGSGESLLRQRARPSALTRASWRDIGVVHLATHARVQDWGLLGNAIYLSASAEQDGRLGVGDLGGMALDVDLVVLSGCRTVGGVVTTGEGVQGLAAPVLEAGARALVATNWNIGDRSLIPLLERFYRDMARGRTASDALHAAKLAALRSGASPAVWAALSLLGDAGVRPLAPAASLTSAKAGGR
jgi:tetratricopeptide (TPR) repeat protein